MIKHGTLNKVTGAQVAVGFGDVPIRVEVEHAIVVVGVVVAANGHQLHAGVGVHAVKRIAWPTAWVIPFIKLLLHSHHPFCSRATFPGAAAPGPLQG